MGCSPRKSPGFISPASAARRLVRRRFGASHSRQARSQRPTHQSVGHRHAGGPGCQRQARRLHDRWAKPGRSERPQLQLRQSLDDPTRPLRRLARRAEPRNAVRRRLQKELRRGRERSRRPLGRASGKPQRAVTSRGELSHAANRHAASRFCALERRQFAGVFRFRVRLLGAVRQNPKLGHLVERAEGRHSAQDQAGHAIQESQSHHIDVKKSKRRPQAMPSQLARRPRRAAVRPLACCSDRPCAGTVPNSNRCNDRIVPAVWKRGPNDFHVGVIAPHAVASQVAAKEPKDRVGIPATVFHLATEAEITAEDAIAVGRRIGRSVEKPANLGRQLRGHVLVGVDNQHPIVRGLWDGPILEIARVDIFPLDDAATPARGRSSPACRRSSPSPRQ